MSLKVGEKQPLLGNPKVEVNNKLTRYARNAAIGLVAITAIGAIATFAAHGGFASIGSDAMIFAGSGAVVAGAAYGGLRFIRDRRQANEARKEWENSDLKAELREIKNPKGMDSMKKKAQLGKKDYDVEAIFDKKDKNKIKEIQIKNS